MEINDEGIAIKLSLHHLLWFFNEFKFSNTC